MIDPFIGQVMAFAGNFPPKGWALCDGSILAIRSNTALFSILGTMYGGDGKVTFALPNLNGALAIGAGDAVSGTSYPVGENLGTQQVTLTMDQMAAHSHTLTGSVAIPANASDDKDSPSPAGHYLSATVGDTYAGSTNAKMGPANVNVQVSPAGGTMPFSIMQPTNGILYCIAVQGIYPPRS